MTPFSTIVVGVEPSLSGLDGLTRPNREAITTGMQLVERSPAGELQLVTVVDHQEKVEAVAQSFDQLAAELHLKERGLDDRAKHTIRVGPAWQQLDAACEEFAADVLILGARPQSRAEPVLIGRTGMKLARACRCSVWITKPGRIGLEWAVGVGDDLVSEAGEDRLNTAVEIALSIDAGLVVIHGLSSTPTDEDESQAIQTATAKMVERLGMTDYRSIMYGTRPHIRIGDPAELLLAAAESFDLDLLVIGASDSLQSDLGSTAEAVLPRVPCSILIERSSS